MLSMIKKEKNKKRLIAVVSFLLLIGLTILGSYHIYNYFTYSEEEAKIEKFFEEENIINDEHDIINENVEVKDATSSIQEDSYIGVLEIPNINFKKGFLDIMHKNNKVDKNIQVIENSDMPNVINGLMVIAGHSGSGRVAFFKNLYKLKLNDEVFIYYNGIKYIYNIVDIYNEEKDGTISVNKKQDETILVLTTCSQTDKTKQIVIIAKQVNQVTY